MKHYHSFSAALLLVTAASCGNAAEPANDATATKREQLVAYFTGPDEPTVEKAAWTSSTVFNVGIHYMGSAEDSFAGHVCEVLRERGFAGRHSVRVIDINTMAAEADWEIIGESRC